MGISLAQTSLDLLSMNDLSKALGLLYKFLKGTGGWIGYVIAAVYYFALDFGVGGYLCEGSKYGYIVIYWLNVVVSFGQAYQAV